MSDEEKNPDRRDVLRRILGGAALAAGLASKANASQRPKHIEHEKTGLRETNASYEEVFEKLLKAAAIAKSEGDIPKDQMRAFLTILKEEYKHIKGKKSPVIIKSGPVLDQNGKERFIAFAVDTQLDTMTIYSNVPRATVGNVDYFTHVGAETFVAYNLGNHSLEDGIIRTKADAALRNWALEKRKDAEQLLQR